MSIDFDQIIDRRGTESTKWDRLRFQYHDEEIVPLWLADMDFPVSAAIHQALVKRAEHPIYGYSDRGPEYYRLFADRFREYHGMNIKEDEVVLSTGVIYSIAAAIHLFTEKGDKVLIFRPCYRPFVDTIENTRRVPVYIDMKDTGEKYVLDLEKMEKVASECKALILCNPHNPTGRILDENELNAIAKICEKHGILIISDEIHSDFVYSGYKFKSIIDISEYTRNHTICCVAPTKSFNLAGLKISAVFIPNKKMKDKFQKYASVIGISSINVFAMEAVKAAYTRSQEWQNELLTYLQENRRIVSGFIDRHEWVIGYMPEGTYFYWLHFKGNSNIYERLIKEAHVALNEGTVFHPEALGFARLNFACPKQILNGALLRIERMMLEGGAV